MGRVPLYRPMNPLSNKNLLAQDVEITGDVRFQDELIIDGKIDGQIASDGILTVGQNADIRGEIKTRSVIIYGKVHGNVTVLERVELKSMAHLVGDLKASLLVIEDGATFIGASAVSSTGAPAVLPKENKGG